MEAFLTDWFKQLPFLVSFLAGILTFLSPCILPLIPAYMSYISGISVEDLKDSKSSHRFQVILASLCFIAGFSTIFITLGIFLDSVLGDILSSDIFRYVAGSVIVIFGIHFLGIFKIKFLYKNFQSNFKASKYRYLGAFVLGLSFSIGWTPCVGPILASILSLSATSKGYGFVLMLLYSLGLGLSFLLVAIALNHALRFIKVIKSYMGIIEKISGDLLILIGLAIIFKLF